jgi:hypothetical protein
MNNLIISNISKFIDKKINFCQTIFDIMYLPFKYSSSKMARGNQYNAPSIIITNRFDFTQ